MHEKRGGAPGARCVCSLRASIAAAYVVWTGESHCAARAQTPLVQFEHGRIRRRARRCWISGPRSRRTSRPARATSSGSRKRATATLQSVRAAIDGLRARRGVCRAANRRSTMRPARSRISRQIDRRARDYTRNGQALLGVGFDFRRRAGDHRRDARVDRAGAQRRSAGPRIALTDNTPRRGCRARRGRGLVGLAVALLLMSVPHGQPANSAAEAENETTSGRPSPRWITRLREPIQRADQRTESAPPVCRRSILPRSRLCARIWRASSTPMRSRRSSVAPRPCWMRRESCCGLPIPMDGS